MEKDELGFAKKYYLGRVRYNELNAVFQQINFPYAILKGEPLSVYMHGKVATKESNDIDILVDKSNIQALLAILKNCGFESSREENRKDFVYYLTFAHQIAPYHKRKGNSDIYVDINFDLFWGGYQGQKIDVNSFLEGTETMNLYGVNVQTLPLYKMLIALMLHHYKDFNSVFLLATTNSLTEKKLTEIYCMIMNNISKINIKQFADLCKKYSVQQFVYYMLYYVNEFYNHSSSFIDELVAALKCEEGDALLDVYGLETKHKWKIDFIHRVKKENLFEDIKSDLSEEELKQIATCSMYY